MEITHNKGMKGPAEICRLLDGNDINKDYFTDEEWQDVLLEAIKQKDANCLRKLMGHNMYSIESENACVNSDRPTLLGQASIHFYDKTVVNILIDFKFKQISKSEVKQLVLTTLRLCETVTYVCGGSCSKECDSTQGLLNEMSEHLYYILTACCNSHIHRIILCMSDLDDFNVLSHNSALSWLYGFLRFGSFDIEEGSILALKEMECGLWTEAKETIVKIKEKTELGKEIFITFPHSEAGSNWTLLSYAVFKQKTDIVQLLISKHHDINVFCRRNQDGKITYFTPFEMAVETSNTEICQLLAENGANLLFQSYGGTGKILKNAIIHGNSDIIRIILKWRSYPNNILLSYINRLPDLQKDDKKVAVIKDILRFKCVHVNNDIFRALEKGDWTLAENIIEATNVDTLRENVQVLVSPYEGSWPLVIFATKMNCMNVLKLLVEKGLNVNAFCEFWEPTIKSVFVSPLIEAVLNKNVDMCKFLLQNGASVTMTEERRVSAWIPALVTRYTDVYELLVNHSDDPGSAFVSYSSDCLAHFEPDTLPLSEVFPLDAMKLLLKNNRVISEASWEVIITEACQYVFTCDKRVAKQMVLKLLLNYLARVPSELMTALAKVYSVIEDSEEPDSFVCKDVYFWLKEHSKRVPSLQTLCRFNIRQSCHSCDQRTIRSLQIPSLLQEYVQHPFECFDVDSLQPSEEKYLYLWGEP